MVISGVASADSVDILQPANLSSEMILQVTASLSLPPQALNSLELYIH